MAGTDELAVVNLLRIIHIATLNSSSESDGEVEQLLLLDTAGAATFWAGEKRPRIQNYVEHTVPQYSRWEFKSHFRMERDSFHFLLTILGEFLNNQPIKPGHPTISAEKQLLIGIWKMVTPDSYRSICDRFDVGRATALRAVRRVQRALFRMSPNIITWPDAAKQLEISAGFQRSNNFPGVIGAVDGTHIKIPAPQVHPESYVNRKNDHSIVLQAVCDHRGFFTHVNAGQPGSIHDARVFRKSTLFDHTTEDAEEKFLNNTHIIGDPAYPISRHLLVAFKNNGHLTDQQKNFNYCLSATRTVIERAFGFLKGRCRSLLFLDMHRLDEIPVHVVACCVIHNICQSRGDIIPEEGIGFEEIPQPEVAIGALGPVMAANRALGVAKRNEIMATLPVRMRAGDNHYQY